MYKYSILLWCAIVIIIMYGSYTVERLLYRLPGRDMTIEMEDKHMPSSGPSVTGWGL